MAFVEQICEGYNKKTLIGNWHEERLYPRQPFREDLHKEARNKDEAITCYDGRGFQRALPRLQRRDKWATTERVILNDGINQKKSAMKTEYPHGEQQSTRTEMQKPFSKTNSSINPTSLHSNSELKPNHKAYHLIDMKNATELTNNRDVNTCGVGFKTVIPTHPANLKHSNYISEYNGKYVDNTRGKTVSEWQKTKAGSFNPVPEESVKPITTLVCENVKHYGDAKEITHVQRSWLPPRDRAASLSMNHTATEFRKGSKPANDIQTSTNMNVGLHSLHVKDVPENYFRHIQQDVTVTYNKTLCSRP